jgi:hypothetical protein
MWLVQSEKGRDAVCSPQTDNEARSIAIAGSQRCSRRVPARGHGAEPTANGETALSIATNTGVWSHVRVKKPKTKSPIKKNLESRLSYEDPAPRRAGKPDSFSTE